MNRYLFLFITLIFTSCSEFAFKEVSSTKDLTLISKYPLITDKEPLLLNIVSMMNSELIIQDSFIKHFEASWIYNLRSNNNFFKNIEVEVKEYQPIAIWMDESFLTQSGFIISPKHTSIDFDLVRLRGEEDKRFTLLEYSRKLQPTLTKIHKSIHSMVLNSGYLKVTTKDETTIFFDYKEFRGQLKRLEDLIKFELSSGNILNINRMDFRYKDGVAVQYS